MRAMTLVLGLALIANTASEPARAEAPAPQPFVATYHVSFRGIGAGTLTFKLQRNPSTGHYIYETRANPSLLARLVVSSAALEHSTMQIDAQGVRPLEWHLDDGKSGKKEDGRLRFDWERNTVTGEIEGEPIELALEPGVQDRQSIQIAVMTSLMRGADPGTIPLIDDNRIKRYTYTKKDHAVVDSKLGKLDSIVYESTREGSNRVSRFWFVPEMQFVPARAEQVRKGRVETVMELVEYKLIK